MFKKGALKNNFQTIESFRRSIFNSGKSKQANVSVRVSTSSTTLANIIICFFFFGLILGVKQVRTMLIYNVKEIVYDPIVTTLLMCLLSFSLFVFSRFSMIRRKKLLQSKFNIKIIHDLQDDRISVFLYWLPILFQVCLLIFSTYSGIRYIMNSDKVFTLWMLNIPSLLTLAFYAFLFNKFAFNTDKILTTSSVKFNDYEYRIGLFAKWLRVIIFTIILVYCVQTAALYRDFGGEIGIGVFDIISIFLVFFRGFLAYIFYLYCQSTSVTSILDTMSFKLRPEKYLAKQGEAPSLISRESKLAFIKISGIFFFILLNVFINNEFYTELMSVKCNTISQNKKDRMKIEDYTREWLNQKLKFRQLNK